MERPLLALGDGRLLTQTVHGHWMQFHADDLSMGLHLLQSGDHEPWVQDAWRWLLRPGDHVAIVGSNLGFHDILVGLAVEAEGHVYGFEPNPLVVPYLKRNLILNGLFGRCEAIGMAVGDACRAEVVFHQLGEDWGGSGLRLLPQNQHKRAGVAVVPQTTLDSYFVDKRLDVVKIDAEGSEAAVLAGGWQTVPRLRAIVLEHNPDYYSAEFQRACEGLAAFGLTPWALTPDQGRRLPKLERLQALHALPSCDLAFVRADAAGHPGGLERLAV